MGELRSAAFRLKHNLGKGVVFHAPADPEADPEALRARLAEDLLATRRDHSGAPLAAPEVFDRWSAEEGPLLVRPGTGELLAALAARVEGLRPPLSRLASLPPPELLALDRAAREVARLASAVHRAAVALEGEEG